MDAHSDSLVHYARAAVRQAARATFMNKRSSASVARPVRSHTRLPDSTQAPSPSQAPTVDVKATPDTPQLTTRIDLTKREVMTACPEEASAAQAASPASPPFLSTSPEAGDSTDVHTKAVAVTTSASRRRASVPVVGRPHHDACLVPAEPAAVPASTRDATMRPPPASPCARCPRCGGCAYHLRLCAHAKPVRLHTQMSSESTSTLAGVHQAREKAKSPQPEHCGAYSQWRHCTLFVPMPNGTRLADRLLPAAARCHILNCTADAIQARFAAPTAGRTSTSIDSNVCTSFSTSTSTGTSITSSSMRSDASWDEAGTVSDSSDKEDHMLTNTASTSFSSSSPSARCDGGDDKEDEDDGFAHTHTEGTGHALAQGGANDGGGRGDGEHHPGTAWTAPLPCPVPLVSVFHALFLVLAQLETTVYLCGTHQAPTSRPHLSSASPPRTASADHARDGVDRGVWPPSVAPVEGSQMSSAMRGCHSTTGEPRLAHAASLYEVAQQQGFTELGLTARAVWEHLCFSTGLLLSDHAGEHEGERTSGGEVDSAESMASVSVSWCDVPFVVILTALGQQTSVSPVPTAQTTTATGEVQDDHQHKAAYSYHHGGFRLFVPQDFFFVCVAEAMEGSTPHTPVENSTHSWQGWPLYTFSPAGSDAADGAHGTSERCRVGPHRTRMCPRVNPSRTWWTTIYRTAGLARREHARHAQRSMAASQRVSKADAPGLPILFHHRRHRQKRALCSDDADDGDEDSGSAWCVVQDLLAVLAAHVFRRVLLSPFTQRCLTMAPSVRDPVPGTSHDRAMLPSIVV